MIPLTRQICPTSVGVNTAASIGTALVSGAGAGVFGSWTQLAAATDTDSAGFYVSVVPFNAGCYHYEFAIGASGSEVSIGICAVGAVTTTQFVPIFIPAGSRLSVRLADNSGGNNAYCSAALVRGARHPGLFSKGTAYGLSSGVGPTVDGGATANVKSAWVQLTAATGNAARAYTLCLFNGPSSANNAHFLVDLAVGASGSEVPILSNVAGLSISYNYGMSPHAIGPIHTPIPAGSRLAVRAQFDTTTATDRILRPWVILWE